MGDPQSKDSGRKHYRCPVSGPRRLAELQIGAGRLSVEVHDESATGFAVDTRQNPMVRVGDPVVLSFDGVTFECRVANIRRLETGSMHRLGLQRLGEAFAAEEGPKTGRTWLSALLRTPSWSSPAKNLGAGLALAAVVTAVAAGLALWGKDPRRVWQDIARVWDGRSKAAPAPAPSIRANQRAEQPAAGDAPPSATAGPAAESTAPNLARYARLPGASAFLAPEVVQALGLTEEQKARIREIADASAAELKATEAKTRGLSRQEQSRRESKILDAARARALTVLTPEQQQRWESLVWDSSNQPDRH